MLKSLRATNRSLRDSALADIGRSLWGQIGSRGLTCSLGQVWTMEGYGPRTVCLGQLLERDGIILGGIQVDRNLGLEFSSHIVWCRCTQGRTESYLYLLQVKALGRSSPSVLNLHVHPPPPTPGAKGQAANHGWRIAYSCSSART
jgi:hypothetical protein